MHHLPPDLKKTIFSNPKSLSAWEKITPLAKNEWICWVLNAKKIETRENRISRTSKEIALGKKRPCCFAGCPHREK